MPAAPDPFALDPDDQSAEALTGKLRYGLQPLAAAATLVRRGDPETPAVARLLVACAAFVEPEDLGALGLLGATDALASVLLASWLPAPLRVAAAQALADVPVTPAGLASLVEVAEGPRRPPWAQAAEARLAMQARAGAEVRAASEQLRLVARHLRERTRGELGRQEHQRAVAAGAQHPAVGALAGDGTFLAGLLPPVADQAREALLPWILAAARQSDEPTRTKLLAMFHRRWRDVAAGPVGCVARTSLKARDASLGAASIRALGAMGALDELASVAGATAGALRASALAELEKAGARARAEVRPGLLGAALARALSDPDPAVRARAEKLSGEALTAG